MSKIKNLIKKLAIPFALIGTLATGAFFTGVPNITADKTANAEFSQYEQIANNLPEYVEISMDSTSQHGRVENTIYLFQNDSYKNIVIGSDEIVNSETSTQVNYGFIPKNLNPAEGRPNTYYYFDFQTSLSLYYDLTNEDIKNGLSGENLLREKNISDFTENHSSPFVPTGYSFTPQKFDLKLKLDTSKANPDTMLETSGNEVTLYNEGCYTLAIPISLYSTNNDGLTFTLSESTVYYTFMLFNANTYFDNVTGRPNLIPSTNMQESVINSSSAYSNYYFYNFAYGNSINTLPTISYDPNKFQLRISYSNLDQEVTTSIVEYSNGNVKQLDEYGTEYTDKNKFIETNLNDTRNIVITFTKLGSYDISINYLYVSQSADGQTTYNLPLAELKSDSDTPLSFENKAQRLYMYGYQAVYSDYSDKNPQTNQPNNKELKTLDFETNTYGFDNISEEYSQTADITSLLNNYIINNPANADDKKNAEAQNPSKSTNYDLSSLYNYALAYINQEGITPISTNQTPIKFLTNARLDSTYSKIYSVENDGTENTLSEIGAFQGFNQNNAGTYLYIIQYKFDSFMSQSGTLQSSFYHYQVFYFKVTNTTPTVTVYDNDFNEIYTGGFTNKHVYILNDAENNLFDATVEILISAKNYKNNSYYFPATKIQDLAPYGLVYQKFEESAGTEPSDIEYNENVAGKYGILIENTRAFANSHFTVQIKSSNSNKPSTRTFTIDTNPITNIIARNTSIASSTSYRIGETLTHYATNQPFVLSWNPKDSGASTYGYIKYVPMTAINYYSSLNEDKLAQLLSRLISHDTLPVSYKLNLESASSWSEYTNSNDFSSTIPATYVKSNDGIYILEVYDQAGNNAFAIFLKDSTSPIFIEEIVGDSTVRKLISNSDSISVPEAGVEISIKWTKNKAIYIENINNYTSFEAYKFGINVADANEKLQKTLDDFFNSQVNTSIKVISDITLQTTEDSDPDGYAPTGINSFNGSYLIIPINSRAYLKDAKSSTFRAYDESGYKIRFIDDNDEAIEGTYKILIRDLSNSAIYPNEELNYTLYPSGYLSFNVTSDASKLNVQYSDGSNIDYSNYSMSGKLFSYKDDMDNICYTHLADNGKVETDPNYKEYDETELTYKFLYHTPINAKKELQLSFIPVAENGSKLASIVLYYYPYELENFEQNYTVNQNGVDVTKTNYQYYYKIADEPKRIINVFTISDKNYEQDQVEIFELALGTDTLPLAGKYVIERLYVDGNATDKYDYFKRTISFTVDDFSLISPLETVTNADGSASSLESVVGSDIILSMYSDNGLSEIEVSFPSYNENGLNTGSFYSKESFSDENLQVFAIEGNKLPMSLYIPSVKYTIGSYRNVNERDKTYYSVDKNNDLSYYGQAYWIENDETEMFDVYVEGVVVETFGSAEMAQKYIDENITIAEYKIKAEIQVNIAGQKPRYYYSNGSVNNYGYLNFYPADGKNGNIIPNSLPVEFFYDKGEYVVTLYQASNIGATSSFYSIYKFGFKIISQEPDFTIYGADGYELTNTKNTPNVYYTNSDNLTVEWLVPTSKYQAKIDEANITIRSFPSTSPAIRSDIEDGTGTRYFTLDTSNLIKIENSYVTITMQYEGYNSNYYHTITKTIFFDRSAPMQNLSGLMTLTENATNLAFPVNYQQYFMRKYFDYQNQEIGLEQGLDITKMSYSYSVDSGEFKYFSYNVTKDFFNVTLKQTIQLSETLPYDTQYIYYKFIDNIKSYTQVDKSSFSFRNYSWIDTDDAELYCGYYEIVELDYAGNMTVYIVYLIDSSFDSDPNVRNDAITYFNNIHASLPPITDNQITDGFNIYSNSGFEVIDLNYRSDPWAFLNVTLSGQTAVRYMKSPWIEENSIYKVTFSASGINLEQISLSNMFDNVDSSSNKHQLIFTDRITGTNRLVYLSIMDASINTQKIEDPAKTSAILNISVPSNQQYESTVTSYVFPTNIVIYQYDQFSPNPDKWEILIDAYQTAYGEWAVSDERYTSALEYISFNILPSGNVLQVVINLGVNASQKIKYEIVDNFGNCTTVIQLANEVSYREIEGDHSVYQFTEPDNSITYLSSQTIRYSYNVLLYNVTIFDRNGDDITTAMAANRYDNATTNITIYSFNPSETNIYDDYYKLVIEDVESGTILKTLHIRLNYNLPYLTFVANEVHTGGIVFNDKNQQPIDKENVNSISSISVNFHGSIYTTSGYAVSSYDNVTVKFKNGQEYAYEGSYEYQFGYTYSVYLSRDNGTTWENINSPTSAIGGYTISGIGDYLILIKYDSDKAFSNLCKIFTVSIIDQGRFPLYSIRVDNMPVEKSNIKYTSLHNIEYEINYVVSVDWADKDNRLTIITNEDKGVLVSLIDEESTGTNVHVEIYHYSSNDNRVGDFTIIYIEETSNFVSTFTYDTPVGTTVPLKDTSYAMVASNKETENNFDKLKLNFTSSYGIPQNKINAEVLKLFNGSYVQINCKVYEEGEYSYIYLERAGSYRIKLYDSCTPANVQTFKGSQYIDIVFLSSVPFLVSHVDEDGNTIITEPIQKAVYNNDVTIELTNLYNDSYYQPSGYPVISVKLNGKNYTDYKLENRKFVFSEPGFYTVKFSATSKTNFHTGSGVQIREEEYNFSIIKKNELKFAYEISEFGKYYIQKVEKDGVDITNSLVNMGNFKTTVVDGIPYLSGLTISHSLQDEKTGDGRYKITINPNSNGYENVIGNSYTFEIRIGYITTLPINISINEGDSSTKDILVSFNVRNLYNAVGDCYIRVADIEMVLTGETLADYAEVETITIKGAGTHYVQVYTLSGRPLYSYKVVKADPLNGFAIIAIILGVVAFIAIVVITIKIRKRQKAK